MQSRGLSKFRTKCTLVCRQYVPDGFGDYCLNYGLPTGVCVCVCILFSLLSYQNDSPVTNCRLMMSSVCSALVSRSEVEPCIEYKIGVL